MILFEQTLSCPWALRLGWALVHSLWQIAAVGVLVAMLLRLLDRRSAHLRYLVACGGLITMLLAPVATYWFVDPPGGAETVTVLAQSSDDGARATTAKPAEVPFPSESKDFVDQRDAAGAVDQSLVAETEPAPPAKPTTPVPSLVTREGLSRFLAPCVPWIVLLWAAGVGALSFWHVGGYIVVRRLQRRGVLPAPAWLAQQVDQLRVRLGIARPVRLLQSILVDVPVVVGWLRPVILTPAAALTELSPQALDAVLAHELAHIRRSDYLVNLLQTVVETLLFFHPAVWWVSRQVRLERENCCDDVAVAVSGSRIAYAQALTTLETARRAPQWALAATGRARAGTLLSRIRRILGVPSGPHERARLLARGDSCHRPADLAGGCPIAQPWSNQTQGGLTGGECRRWATRRRDVRAAYLAGSRQSRGRLWRAGHGPVRREKCLQGVGGVVEPKMFLGPRSLSFRDYDARRLDRQGRGNTDGMGQKLSPGTAT